MEINWDDDATPTNRQRTQRILLTVAIVPWLVIIAVFITQRSAPAPTMQPSATVNEPATDNMQVDRLDPPQTTQPAPTASPAAPLEPTPVALEASQRTAVEAFALMMASEYLHDPTWRPDDLTIEQLAIEQIDLTSPSVVIVIVVAQYRTATKTGLFRIAVPVVPNEFGDLSALPLYPIPSDPDPISLPDLSHLTPLTDHEPALDALKAAGFGDITALELLGAPDWPALAVITYRTSNGDTELAVLLHETADGYVVAGSTPNKKVHTGPLNKVLR
ncbi:MAG: hypothetical protein WD360_01520 [Nitriliruptoraceae bacterium]